MKEKRMKKTERTIPENVGDIVWKMQNEFIDTYKTYLQAYHTNNVEQIEISTTKLNKCFEEAHQFAQVIPEGTFNSVGYLEFIKDLIDQNPEWDKNELNNFIGRVAKEIQEDRKHNNNKPEEKLKINQKYFEMVVMQLRDYAELIRLHKKACDTNNIAHMTLLMDLINNARRNRCETFNDKDKKFCRATLDALEDAICQGMHIEEKDFMDLFTITKSQK